MPSIVDVNVILPLILVQHPHRVMASAWWNGCADESVIFTLPVRMGTLRLLTNRAVMGSGVLSPESAWDSLATLTDDARSVVRDDSPTGLNVVWLRLVRDREPTPNLWTDAWLAAYAEALDCDMVTFDKGYRSFGLAKLQLLGP